MLGIDANVLVGSLVREEEPQSRERGACCA
jgi:hypothetical protein